MIQFKKIASLLSILSFIGIIIFISCKKEYSCEGCAAQGQGTNSAQQNHPPVARAGIDQTIFLPTNTTNLDGSSSTDPDGNITTYVWTKISGPTTFNIANSNATQSQVTGIIEGSYLFELKVTDAGGLFSKDTIRINVISSQTPLTCVIPGSTQVGSFQESVVEAASVVCNNKFYFAAGSYMDIFDPATNITTRKNLSISREHLTAASTGNKVFFAGGYIYTPSTSTPDTPTARIDVYNTTTNAWSTAELSVARFGISTCTIGNKVLFAGGMTDVYTSTSRVDIYDLSTDTWSQRELSQPGRFVSAIVNNKVWFVTHTSNQIDVYDPLTNSWSTSLLSSPVYSSFPPVINNNTAITLNNKVYFTGCQTVRIYDIPSQSWSSIILSENKFYIPAAVSNNKIAFIGGMTSWYVYSRVIEIYDPANNSWDIQYMGSDLFYAAFVSYNNYIYSAGGMINQENTNLSSICRFQL